LNCTNLANSLSREDSIFDTVSFSWFYRVLMPFWGF
jgi:hypothetical protein